MNRFATADCSFRSISGNGTASLFSNSSSVSRSRAFCGPARRSRSIHRRRSDSTSTKAKCTPRHTQTGVTMCYRGRRVLHATHGPATRPTIANGKHTTPTRSPRTPRNATAATIGGTKKPMSSPASSRSCQGSRRAGNRTRARNGHTPRRLTELGGAAPLPRRTRQKRKLLRCRQTVKMKFVEPARHQLVIPVRGLR